MSAGMRPDGPDNHPRMAELYDLEGGWSEADDFFLAVVDRHPRSSVLDLGCGTGRLTIALAAAGHTVTGVEPNRAFLDAARAKPGADRVQWIEGTSSALPAAAFDTAVLTGHVVHAFVTDEEWDDVLADVRRSLVPTGTLAFDSRDPEARGWEAFVGGWRGSFADGLAFDTRASVVDVDGEVVRFEVDTVLADGVRRQGTSDYRFRTATRLCDSVERAGFAIEAVLGGWRGEEPGSGSGELVVLATAVAAA